MGGYLFQCRLALLLGLRRAKRFPGEWVSIETFDDVAFDQDGAPREMLQAKHHGDAKAVGDGDADLWKTLRIWIADFQRSGLPLEGKRYVLITTAEARDGSALALLRPGRSKSDIEAACVCLCDAASRYEAEASKLGREAFLTLSQGEARLLLSQIDVIDRHPNLANMREELEGELRILGPDYVERITDDLEGWWFARVAERLVNERGAAIPLQNLQRKANDIAAKYMDAGLPIEDPERLGVPKYSKDDEGMTFVRQMRAIAFPETAVRRGVQDFYRASVQRSTWARDALLLDGEAEQYDAGLVDRYERRYDQMVDEASGDTAEEKARFGRTLCHWACQQEVQFRDVVETWITSGSFHALADRSMLGWHPDHPTLFPRLEDDDDDPH